jgi:hypothetical protein
MSSQNENKTNIDENINVIRNEINYDGQESKKNDKYLKNFLLPSIY